MPTVGIGFKQQIPGVKSPSLSKNVAGVKRLFEHGPAWGSKESAISLSLMGCRIQPKARLQSLRSGTQSDPTISSITTAIMMTTSNSPAKGSGMPNRYVGDLLHSLAISELSRMPTELFQLLIVPSLAPHPVQTRVSGPWLPWRSVILVAWLGGETGGASRGPCGP